MGAARAGAAGAAPRGARNLPHPADRPRNEACGGFPAACVGPFHYTNPGVTDAGHVWTTVTLPAASGRRPAARDRAADLAARAQRLADEQDVENLQKIYGYYYDRRMWDEVADLFADDGTIEMAQRGVYVGKPRVREFLNLLGPVGLKDGELNDHVQLQVVVHVAPDGRSAKARSRELNMTGVFESHGEWSEGIYENTFVKDNGVWKIKDLRYFPTFISDYDKGWAQRREACAGGERGAAARSAADERLRDLPEGAHPAVPLRQPRERASAALSARRAAGRAMPRSPPCARTSRCRAQREAVSRSRTSKRSSRKPSSRSRAPRTSTRSTT